MGNIVKASTIGEAVEALGEPLNVITFRFGFGKSDFDVPKFRQDVASVGFLYYDAETETFSTKKKVYAKRTDDDIKFYYSSVSFPKHVILDITDFSMISAEGNRAIIITINKEFDDAFVKEHTEKEYLSFNELFIDPTKPENYSFYNYILVDDDSTILLSEYKKLILNTTLNTTERDTFDSFYINPVVNHEVLMSNVVTSDTMAVCIDTLTHNGFGKVKWITEISNLKIVGFTVCTGLLEVKIRGLLVERIDQE